MLSAVPSQSADAFPAGMLFKSRNGRRRDLPRSFTLRGGLSTFVEGVARQPRVEVVPGTGVSLVERTPTGYAVLAEDGQRHHAAVVALATPPGTTSRLLRAAAPELATQTARVRETTVETVGFAVRAEKVRLPTSMFLVPRDDTFHSVVTRDSVPDASWRGFSFHFKPHQPMEARVQRVTRILGLEPGDLEELTERTTILPSPVLGHEDLVREFDRLLAPGRLCLTGNWFGGLSIEDCVDRSFREWARVEKLG
jgi:UDP-galactopyranose mutase